MSFWGWVFSYQKTNLPFGFVKAIAIWCTIDFRYNTYLPACFCLFIFYFLFSVFYLLIILLPSQLSYHNSIYTFCFYRLTASHSLLTQHMTCHSLLWLLPCTWTLQTCHVKKQGTSNWTQIQSLRNVCTSRHMNTCWYTRDYSSDRKYQLLQIVRNTTVHHEKKWCRSIRRHYRDNVCLW